jgi:hypothetical protein
MEIVPKVIILNQALVREKLQQKKYDDVCLSAWGHLDEFVHFIISFGILDMLARLGLSTGHSGIPAFILVMLVFSKSLFGPRFDDNIKYLVKVVRKLFALGLLVAALLTPTRRSFSRTLQVMNMPGAKWLWQSLSPAPTSLTVNCCC